MSSAIAAVLAFLAMEPMAWAAHRWLMHGPMWGWHESHHAPRDGAFERNDRFALVFAAVAFALVFSPHLGAWDWVRGIGIGITSYGLAYALLHDVLVHRRWVRVRRLRGGYLGRLIDAHHMHHASRGRDGGVSFGFLYAPPLPALRRRMAAQRAGAHSP